MGSHPLNLALRFALELIALIAVGMWGWKQGNGSMRYVLAAALPIVIGAVWGSFAVPDDPSRSGTAPFEIPGYMRLILEFLIFGIAVYCLKHLGYSNLYLSFGAVVILHYILSWDRIIWLMSR